MCVILFQYQKLCSSSAKVCLVSPMNMGSSHVHLCFASSYSLTQMKIATNTWEPCSCIYILRISKIGNYSRVWIYTHACTPRDTRTHTQTHTFAFLESCCHLPSLSVQHRRHQVWPGRVPEARRAQGGPGDHSGPVAVATDQAVNLAVRGLQSGPS